MQQSRSRIQVAGHRLQESGNTSSKPDTCSLTPDSYRTSALVSISSLREEQKAKEPKAISYKP